MSTKVKYPGKYTYQYYPGLLEDEPIGAGKMNLKGRVIKVKVGGIDPAVGVWEAWSPDDYELCGGTHHAQTRELAFQEIKEYIENRHTNVVIDDITKYQ